MKLIKQITVPLLLFVSMVIVSTGCYSFKGISIPNEIDTYNVPFVEIQTADAPVGVNQDFQDKLIEKISRESRLNLNTDKPDISLQCSITRFAVEAISPNANNNVDASRLVVGIRVEYKDIKTPKNNWSRTFNGNEEFETGTNLLAVQDELLDAIFDRIVGDIFDKAFTNW